MALIKCPECGREISDKAPACIHCGLPLAEAFKNTQENLLGSNININREIDKVIEQFENFRIRKAAFFYKTSKFTYDAFYTDVSTELMQKTLSNNSENLSDYEAIDFVVENTQRIDSLCVNPKHFDDYAKYVIEIGNLLKNRRYAFFSFGCWMYWLKSLNYNKLNNETIMQLTKIIAKGNFTA